jgi:hypothetical protein
LRKFAIGCLFIGLIFAGTLATQNYDIFSSHSVSNDVNQQTATWLPPDPTPTLQIATWLPPDLINSNQL